MTTGTSAMSQKEYLQKYLSKNKKKKKKVKISSSSLIKRSQIIDDDIDDLVIKGSVDDDEFDLDYLGDEAPQIAGIVDDRPLEMRSQEQYSTNNWKNIEESVDVNSAARKIGTVSEVRRNKCDDIREQGQFRKKTKKDGNEFRSVAQYNSDVDICPPRKKDQFINRGRSDSSDLSPLRESVKEMKKKNDSGSDSDMSVPRKFGGKNKMDSFRTTKKRNEHEVRGLLGSKMSYEDMNDMNISKKNDRYNPLRNKYTGGSDSDVSLSRKFKHRVKKNDKGEVYNVSSDSDGSQRRSGQKDIDYNGPSKRRNQKEILQTYRRDSDSDMSPPRKSNKRKETDFSKTSKRSDRRLRRGSDSDRSSSRKVRGSRRDNDRSNSRRNDRGNCNDISPPRKTRLEYSEKYYKHESSKRECDLKDFQWKQRENSQSNLSSSRKFQSEASHSLENTNTSQSRKGDKDRSQRGSSNDSYLSPPRKSSGRSKSNYGDSNSLRNKRLDRKTETEIGNNVKRRTRDDSSDCDRNRHRQNISSPVRGKEKKDRPKLMEKTLDGKKAGLQQASSLKEELNNLKLKEDQMFKEMAVASTDEGLTPIMRDRKTGKKRDLQKEKEVMLAKSAKEAETKEKYYKWGKGLKQIEDSEKRISELVREISKPLARYAADEDLENHLKAQEREGDPMLDYIKQKQAESVDLTQPSKQKYKGSFMPNRFGIAPGYRWDGVDRSSGYERQWFETRNAKKAVEEEAYKWSTSDM